jgi:hypothetical protein
MKKRVGKITKTKGDNGTAIQPGAIVRDNWRWSQEKKVLRNTTVHVGQVEVGSPRGYKDCYGFLFGRVRQGYLLRRAFM